MEHDHTGHDNAHLAGTGKWVLIGFLAVAAFFLWTEHRAHVLGILPYLVFLACPLMHLFHHHGHGHHHGAAPQDESGGPRPTEERKLP
jgi:hypothetical protein